MLQKWFKYGLILVFAACVAHAESSKTNVTVKATTGSRSFAVSGKKIPRRSESDCSANAPKNPWGDTAPAATPENGYWRSGWNNMKGWF